MTWEQIGAMATVFSIVMGALGYVMVLQIRANSAELMNAIRDLIDERLGSMRAELERKAERDELNRIDGRVTKLETDLRHITGSIARVHAAGPGK